MILKRLMQSNGTENKTMFESITTFLSNNWMILTGTGAIAPIIGYILKKIPVTKIRAGIGESCFFAGKATTLFLGKRFKYTAPFWNWVIEPWVIVFLQSIIVHGLNEFVKGLEIDNNEKKIDTPS